MLTTLHGLSNLTVTTTVRSNYCSYLNITQKATQVLKDFPEITLLRGYVKPVLKSGILIAAPRVLTMKLF